MYSNQQFSSLPNDQEDLKLISFIGYASGIGGQFSGAQQGPDYLKNYFSQQSGLPMSDWQYLVSDKRSFFDLTPEQVLQEVIAHSNDIGRHTLEIVENNRFPVMIGGDHSSASGFWSGISVSQRDAGEVGLIWIDAHMDSHTPETSPNGYVHGMPLASLLGYGHKGLVELFEKESKFSSRNICMIGIRDYEPEERVLLERLGVKVFYMQDVKRLGMSNVFDQAISIVTKNTVGYGVSLDLDGIDPIQAPGVSTPSSQGLDATELLEQLTHIFTDTRLLGVEIAEFNPANDVDNQTADFVLSLVKQLYKGS